MATYYIDPKCGNNNNDGLSEASALKDVENLKVCAGDTVLFKRGSFIRGGFTTVCGVPGAPVTYGAYGEGAKPVFCGSLDLSDPKLWKQEDKNIWACDSADDEACNFIYNNTFCGTLRWSKEELSEQGDFFDNCFGLRHSKKPLSADHKIYIYSEKNPGEYYESIECAVFGKVNLALSGCDMRFENLRFINTVHAIAGEGPCRNMTVDNCEFEHIGGGVWSVDRKIRYGNAVEMWNVAENITVTNCYFNDIYDSAVTHQGGPQCEPAVNFIITDNLFLKCGMGAYEQRDKMTISSCFNNNICAEAGEGFSKLGEIMPRNSEIHPQPMGHHIFIWRIENPTDGGKLEVKNNIFANAPYGAAIYSIISKEAEAQMDIENNGYYTENPDLLTRLNETNYKSFDEYKENGAVCKTKEECEAAIEKWLKKHHIG